MAKISFIVPVYKAEAYLETCIESILCQRGDFEIILIDDGSPDRCGAICDRYAASHAIIKVIHQQNAGHTKARLAGLGIADGEYICFVDSDDFISPEYLSSVEGVLSLHFPDIILIGYDMYYAQNTRYPYRYPYPEGFYTRAEMEAELFPSMLSLPRDVKHGIATAGCVKVYRKEIILQAMKRMNKNMRVGEDIVQTFASIFASQSLYILQKSLYVYRQLSSSMMHNYDPNLLEDTHDAASVLGSMSSEPAWTRQVDAFYYNAFESEIYNAYLLEKGECLKAIERIVALPEVKEYAAKVDVSAAWPLAKRIFHAMAKGQVRRVYYLTALQCRWDAWYLRHLTRKH